MDKIQQLVLRSYGSLISAPALSGIKIKIPKVNDDSGEIISRFYLLTLRFLKIVFQVTRHPGQHLPMSVLVLCEFFVSTAVIRAVILVTPTDQKIPLVDVIPFLHLCIALKRQDLLNHPGLRSNDVDRNIQRLFLIFHRISAFCQIHMKKSSLFIKAYPCKSIICTVQQFLCFPIITLLSCPFKHTGILQCLTDLRFIQTPISVHLYFSDKQALIKKQSA